MDQKVIPFETHQLPIQKVDVHALYVTEKLKQAGFVAYLVGGSVRDLLLNQTPKDFDISTSAKPEEIKKIFNNCILIGRRFRLAHVRFGKKILEVSTFRAGDTEKDELILRDNVWGYPEEDALRRDFTINGLFYDPSNQTIIDYVGGYADIKKKYLRTIGQPFVRFKQDPVRMLRLLKFQARFGFEVDPDAHIALVECREEITKSSPARIVEEMLRMLESGAAKSFIQLLTHHGLMYHLLPGIANFIEREKESDFIYNFLQEIDSIFLDPTVENLDRPVLLSSLTYPLLEKKLKVQYLDRNHIPHLGQVQELIRDTIAEMYEGFFMVPRRLRISVNNILMGQYRFTPLHKKTGGRKRIPRDSDFPMALKFLNLRACLEPGLKQIYDEWNETYKSVPREEPSPERRPRRRRRSRKA
ncbi:MAG: polynucleotide adenylyltransferase PcnB [Verrucomicrobia bacterium]|nr:polynucleotide adenylyltransferase PcnB [Verrucomicrobiota bacterium]